MSRQQVPVSAAAFMAEQATRRDPDEVRDAKVNCGRCTACCQSGIIGLFPNLGDDVSSYQTTEFQGRPILAHKPGTDSECIYLDRQRGCTIHARRPALCRHFDCVAAYYQTPKHLRAELISSDVRAAAKKRRGAWLKANRR